MTGERILTQNALTGEWLATALPLTELEYGDELNGPGSLSGKLAPRLVSQSPTLLDPGTTLIYVEIDGQLRWGGIVWDARPKGNEFAIEAAGWSSYLEHRYDWDGELGGRGPYVFADRCRVLRDIWAYAQSITDGNLDVQVDTTTSTSTVGTPDDVLHSNPWDAKTLGSMADDLVSADASPDYACAVGWNADKMEPVRQIRIGWPRLGARRTDIEFRSGANIVEDPEVELAGDEYAQVVIAMGSGDGSAKQRQTSAVRNGRLRLEYVLSAPDVQGNDILASMAEAERTRRQILGTVNQITIRDTTTAPFGSWEIGDDVYVRVYNPWVNYAGWRRITGWSIKPDSPGGPQAVITLEPSDSYQYGGV